MSVLRRMGDLLELRLGVWGTLLAVPMLVTVKACCDRIEDLKPIGELLGGPSRSSS